MEKEIEMSKNNYRDYSKKKVEDKPIEVTEEVKEEVKAEPEKAEEKPKRTRKKKVDTKGLDNNTLAKEYPTGVVNCPKLRVRTAPKIEPNNVTSVITKGTKVTILEDLGEWFSIEFNKNSVSVRAFVMSKFINR